MMMKTLFKLTLICSFATCFAFKLQADTLSVWTTANSGTGSLREAIQNAGVSDTIYILTTDTIRTTATLNFNKSFRLIGTAGGAIIKRDAVAAFIVFNFSGGNVYMENITITNGSGVGNGGGIAMSNTNLTMENYTITGNQAQDGGGINRVTAGSLVMRNCTVSNNTAGQFGGGLNNPTLLVNCTFHGNTAVSFGGAISLFANMTMTNCTVTNNSSGNTGGILSFAGSHTIRNSIIAGNTGSNPDVNSGTWSVSYSLVQSSAGNGFVNGVNNNIVGIAPDLGAFQNNGGSRLTRLPNVGSPVIDAGTPDTTGLGLPRTDQRGAIRIAGSAIDLGATESARFIEQNAVTLSFNELTFGAVTVGFAAVAPVPGALPGGVVRASNYFWTITGDGSLAFNSGLVRVLLTDLAGSRNSAALRWLKRTNSGDAWEDLGGEIVGGYFQSTVPFSSLSEFAIGTTAFDNPLPVELSGFSGTSVNEQAKLAWTTQTEINNSGFIVLRDGLPIASYQNYPSLVGQGTSTTETNYAFTDLSVEVGKNYTYKLRSFDLDGTIHDYPQSVSVEVVKNQANVVYEYALSQNYPNPFNPTTTINFTMKEAGMATVKVYDMLGRVVFSESLQATRGQNRFKFNGAQLGSGVYFYSLEVRSADSRAGSFAQTKKMMLVK